MILPQDKRNLIFVTYKPLTAVILDIDHFKQINDTFGHLVGSQMLVEAGRVLKKCVREVDIAIRYGGDEFIVVEHVHVFRQAGNV